MQVIGIDPGISGAIAVVEPNGRVVEVHDMPTMKKGVKGNKKQVNAAALSDILYGRGCAVVIELVAAMPGQGVTSMFNFGDSFGVIRGVVAALELSAQFLTPAKWKRKAGLLGADKDLARTKAIELYPTASQLLTRKKDIGRADAILIAHYGSVILDLQPRSNGALEGQQALPLATHHHA